LGKRSLTELTKGTGGEGERILWRFAPVLVYGCCAAD